MPKTSKRAKPKIASATTATNSNESMAAQPDEKFVASQDEVFELLRGESVFANSIGSGVLGLDQGSILREMSEARRSHLRFQMSEAGGKRTLEEAKRYIDIQESDELDQTLKRIWSQSVDQASWTDLMQVYRHSPAMAKRIWQLIKQEAAKELASGNRMAAALETVEWQRDTWQRAQFLAIREGFAAEWQPRGGIENALIDMMAQAFSEYLHWSSEVHKRTTTEMKILYDSEEERRALAERGHWVPPRLSEHQSVEHAMQMMDRFNRLFLRTLRQLRDLRRYSAPVTINNPKQVNIASDGGKQINVTPNDL